MAFNREWDPDTGSYIVNRDRTGPPKPAASTGTTRSEDGTIVADSATISIPPPTPINVDLPSPNDPLIDSNGRINHRWWRFLNQLYLRTGGVQDNINRVPTTLLGAGSPATMAFASSAATVREHHIRVMSLGSLTLTGETGEPALSNPIEAPSVGSITITGETPTISIA